MLGVTNRTGGGCTTGPIFKGRGKTQAADGGMTAAELFAGGPTTNPAERTLKTEDASLSGWSALTRRESLARASSLKWRKQRPADRRGLVI